MNNKPEKYFHRIGGLMIPKLCDVYAIEENINRFIDAAQELSEALNSNFKNKRFEFFIYNMEMAVDLLRSVYARWLEKEGAAILYQVKNNSWDNIAQRIRTFITELLTLSIDLQKAQSLYENEQEEAYISDIEKKAETLNNLSAISELINEGEYSQASEMLAEMEEAGISQALVPLRDLIVTEKFKEAKETAAELKEKYGDIFNNAAAEPDKTAKVVLAVDDRPEILAGITAILSGWYKTIGVTSGAAALKFLLKHKPDLFLLDIDMPEMNGFELASIIRRTEGCAKTPIVFLTGNSSREYVLNAMKAGGNDFVVKPANRNTLLTKIGKYLI